MSLAPWSLLFLLAGCAASPEFRERVLATVPDDAGLHGLVAFAEDWSRDGKRLAYRAQEGNRCFAVVDGRRGPAFEFMSDPAVSADGSVVAYAARRDGRWRLIVGDRERELEGPVSSVFLSADGRSVGW